MAAPQPSAPHLPATFAHSGPWSEDDFLSLPRQAHAELVDGLLVMSPSGLHRHQRLMMRISAFLDGLAPEGWDVLPEPNIRLGPDRILIPDVAVIARADMDAVITDATDVPLVVEIVSPGNAAYDRILKPRLYAEAGVAHYLRVEWVNRRPEGHLFVLDGADHREVVTSSVIELDTPFAVELDLVALYSTR